MFCRECGTKVDTADRFCVKCGAGQVVDAYAVSAVDSATGTNSSQSTPYGAEMSQSWKHRFALIEKVGGLDYIRDLPYLERWQVSFNIWAFLFGIFYYLVLGMWKKGIVLTLLCIVGSTILITVLSAMGFPARTIDPLSWILPAAIFGSRANVDYYKKVVLGDDEWW